MINSWIKQTQARGVLTCSFGWPPCIWEAKQTVVFRNQNRFVKWYKINLLWNKQKSELFRTYIVFRRWLISTLRKLEIPYFIQLLQESYRFTVYRTWVLNVRGIFLLLVFSIDMPPFILSSADCLSLTVVKSCALTHMKSHLHVSLCGSCCFFHAHL